MMRWIDRDYQAVGDIGFLAESLDNNHGGVARWRMDQSPWRTNISHEPRLHGWCGETDNISTFARGIVRVVRVNAAGDRMQVEQLTGEALATALLECGYPELMP